MRLEELPDPIRKPAALPITAYHRVCERRLAKVTARQRRITLFGPTGRHVG